MRVWSYAYLLKTKELQAPLEAMQAGLGYRDDGIARV